LVTALISGITSSSRHFLCRIGWHFDATVVTKLTHHSITASVDFSSIKIFYFSS
jgi:hypothetical protein